MDGGTTYTTYCPPTRKLRWDLLVRSIPDAVQTFLADLPCWYQNAHAHYTHAGARRDAHGQWIVDTRHTALWSRDPVFFREYNGPLLVVGHTPTYKIRKLLGELLAPESQHQAWELEQLIGIDCDAGAGGPLCALELPTRQYYYEYPLGDA
jgi:hypothetical protein